MTLGEKITLLRKQKGWSQEELADRLDISRQSVSKWESLASVPELDKIIRLSELFDVTTDYLLKDETESIAGTLYPTEKAAPPPLKSARPLRKVSHEEAHSYIELTKTASRFIALGVLLCILSPVCLIMMGGVAERNIDFFGFSLTGDMAGGIGTAIMLLMIASAVGLFILYGMQLEKYNYLEKESFLLETGLSEEIEQLKEAFSSRFRSSIVIGVVLCILAPTPLLLLAAFTASDMAILGSVVFLLVMIAFAVHLFISVGMLNEAYTVLLQTEEYQQEMKKSRNILSGGYWCTITAIYLAVSFFKGNWNISWIIWPVAGVAYAAIINIMQSILKYRQNTL